MNWVPGLLVLSAAPLLALGSFAADEPSKIYECKNAKGEIVYQGDPCIEPAPVAPKPPAPAKPPKAPNSRAASHPRPMTLPPPASPHSPPPRPSGPVDARWATPENALRTFVGAVKDGNRALVLSCLTSGALAELGPDAAALPLDNLRDTVGSFTGFVSEGDLGPYWAIRALRAGTRPKWIFFERTGSGEWKIGAI